VRALEAAEAAKRREEKKLTEREKRKAAVALERERLKQEKEHRQEQVEPQKKRDANIITRKRQREYDGKKGNSWKIKCTEAPKRQKKLVEIMHYTNVMKDACPNNTVSTHYNNHHLSNYCMKYELPFLVSLIISGWQGYGGEFSQRGEESIII
jgi:hypothetical protein